MPDGVAPVIAVVGPTGSGKSALAIELARRVGGEIVSADSMQVYRGMDIGTAKVPEGERAVRHFCIDIADPGEAFSAALFQERARSAFEEIRAAGKRPLLCGGTGFYVRAAIDAYDFAAGEQVGNAVRERYLAMLRAEGPRSVWEALRALDPASAKRIHPNDAKRAIRALEMHEAGESYAERAERLASIPMSVPAIMLGIEVARDELRARIDERVDAMREAGLVDEVRALLAQGFRDGITSKHAIGYKEVVSALDGDITMDEAFSAIKTATKRYAKRQRTWFRRDGRIHWLDGNSGDAAEMADEAMGLLARIERGDGPWPSNSPS